MVKEAPWLWVTCLSQGSYSARKRMGMNYLCEILEAETISRITQNRLFLVFSQLLFHQQFHFLWVESSLPVLEETYCWLTEVGDCVVDQVSLHSEAFSILLTYLGPGPLLLVLLQSCGGGFHILSVLWKSCRSVSVKQITSVSGAFLVYCTQSIMKPFGRRRKEAQSSIFYVKSVINV